MSFIGNIPAEAYSPVAKDTFSGNDSTTDFTLSIPATTNSVEVFVENVQQEPTTAYTISGTTLSFTAAPVTGTNNIYVIHRGPAVQQIVPPAGVALNPSTVTATGDISTDTGVNTDTISEKTAAAGVTIDGVLLKDGTVTAEVTGSADGIVMTRSDDGNTNLVIRAGGDTRDSRVFFGDTSSDSVGMLGYDHNDNSMQFTTNTAEAMRIDSSGRLLVGTTATTPASTTGVRLYDDGRGFFTADGTYVGYFNRLTSDGELIQFRKDGTQVGAIGTGFASDLRIHSTLSNHSGVQFAEAGPLPINSSGSLADNSFDLGQSSVRWDDVYATNGTIQTSDRNDKQDIEELTEAEQRVAVAAKSLLRKFRWKDAVAEKGDDARIHFGIIAQDLQAAFEDEGLDAGRYAMFIYSEWWETYTDVPAVEAQDAVYETVTDEEGNETQVLVSEAVEAKEAYTRTDTYETEEEAPEGAVKKSRMGVRYSELLAFIIGAL